MSKDWTREEELFLKNNYDSMLAKNIAICLKKTKSAIFSKAWKLGLKKDIVRPSTKFIKNIKELPQETHQVLLGSLLGDGSIERKCNCTFSEAHALKQEDYVRWKAEKLTLLKPRIYFCEFKNEKREDYPGVGLRTRTYLVLNTYHKMFYANGKKAVTPEILNRLEPLGVAVWVMDDGTYDYSGERIAVSTNAFTYDQHVMMQNWFKTRFGLSPTITKQKKLYYLKFGTDNTKKLVEIIRPFVLPSMNYKLGLDDEMRKKASETRKRYRSRTDIRERRRLNQIMYRQRPDVKEKSKEYNDRPETRERKRLWARLHRKRLQK